MSKIAELLKLEAQKKAENHKLEVLPKIETLSSIQENSIDRKDKDLDKNLNLEKDHKSSNIPTTPTLLTLPTPLTQDTLPTPPTLKPTSPQRDYAKVANSIIRNAVPEGLFIGKSKFIYDFLYLQTRAAIVPKRSIRLTKPVIMKGSNIGSERTFLKNIRHLKNLGLIKIIDFEGQHGGNEYEVFLPEEIAQPTPPTSLTSRHSRHVEQKVGTLHPPPSTVGDVGINDDKIDGYTDIKTLSIKTNTIDDDSAFAVLNKKLSEAVVKLTGKNPNPHEAEKWGTLADLLILELEVAASRADSISSVPAFLTEVLRRQFFVLRQQEFSKKSTKTKVDAVGKSNAESYEIKPLDEKEREVALIQLQEFAEGDFLEDFQKWYTREDWEWIVNNLASDNK